MWLTGAARPSETFAEPRFELPTVIAGEQARCWPYVCHFFALLLPIARSPPSRLLAAVSATTASSRPSRLPSIIAEHDPIDQSDGKVV